MNKAIIINPARKFKQEPFCGFSVMFLSLLSVMVLCFYTYKDTQKLNQNR